MKPLKVLVLMHKHLLPPQDTTDVDLQKAEWKTEFDVVTTLRKIGHEVEPLGVEQDLGIIRNTIDEWKPRIVFNLLEAFHNVSLFEPNVVSYLELLRVPYTGCNPRGLLLAKDKGLSKKLLAYHRIPMPEFAVFRRGQKIRMPKRLAFPMIVKSLTEESSLGISQASVVGDEQKLVERVGFIHESVGTDALVEQFIDGQELYVGVMGNQRLRVLPVWELQFTKMPEDVHRIATERVKWSQKYQQKYGIQTGELTDAPDGVGERIQHLCKRVYRALELSGYARIDLRLDKDGQIFVLEANPNPHIAQGEDFAESAKRAGLSYEELLQQIIALGLQWRPERKG
ncbi:MAG TPA: ATP-grasp domain-containing protein [Nitrospiraceae bacterium]|nr:ATP-grasp domain-containing protein [Nitrospiraceae bacterium]